MNKSMMLITSTWGPAKTFKLLPVTLECPYAEAIYDCHSGVFALIGKDKKQTFHMLPKLTDTGDVQQMKIGKRDNGKPHAEERKLVESFYEYYIEVQSEIEDFINMFCINADSFDYKQYFKIAEDMKNGMSASPILQPVQETSSLIV